MAFTTFTTGRIKAAEVNANFALCVRTDSIKTIAVTHIYSAAQTFTGGWTAATTCTLANNTFLKGLSTAAAVRSLIGINASNAIEIASDGQDVQLKGPTILTAAAAPAAASQISIGKDIQTTVGGAGGASALAATPRGYWIINVAGTDRVVPYYDKT